MKQMMSNKYAYLSFFLLLLACSSPTETIELVDENDGSKISYTRRTDNFAKQGLYIKTHRDGYKFEEAHYENDTLHGTRTLFFPNGKIQIIENYDMGEFKGPWKTFYENGQLKLEGEYINNRIEKVKNDIFQFTLIFSVI